MLLLFAAMGFAADSAQPTWNHNPDSKYGPSYWGSVASQFATLRHDRGR